MRKIIRESERERAIKRPDKKRGGAGGADRAQERAKGAPERAPPGSEGVALSRV